MKKLNFLWQSPGAVIIALLVWIC